jgi:hypothetical protein
MTTEELAFKNRTELANLNEIDLLNIIEFLQVDRQQWIIEFNKTYNESVKIQKENQELKKQVEDLFSENRNLRKKLENCMTFEDYKYILNKKIKLETQQKEFIKWLENYLEIFDCDNIDEQVGYDMIEGILQKYKEIIGE